MATYISKPGQNLIDIAIQLHGQAEAVVSLAELNNLEIGAELQSGLTIQYDETYIVNKKLVQFINNKIISSE
jgi:hypothetical protein